MTALRRRFAQLRCQRWLDGRRKDGSYGVLWLTPAAEEMKEADWNFPEGRFLAYVLGADGTRAGADLYRAERRARRDRFHIAEDARIQELAAGAEHDRGRAERRPDFASGAETKAPPRSVLAFAGAA